MTEEERTVELDRTAERTDADATTDDPVSDPEPAVYDGDAVTRAFNDRVETDADAPGRVVGLSRADGDTLRLTVETADGRLAEFVLADPGDDRLDGRLRRLYHLLGGADESAVEGSLVPLTTVDGTPAIDWERVPEAPTNPSTSVERDPAETVSEDSLAADVLGRAGGLALTETLLAVSGGLAAGAALLLAGAVGSPALAGAAAIQVALALALVLRARYLRSSGVE